VDVGLDRPRPEEGLAESRQPLVGADFDEQDVGELVEPERVYLDELLRSDP
jgi:hypothetical protein